MWQNDTENEDRDGWDDAPEAEVSFTGTVRPSDRDEWGRITEVSIKPWGRYDDPISVRVDPASDGQDLVHHPYAVVTVTGYVRADEYGRKTIYVTDYELEEEDIPGVVFQRRREMRRWKNAPHPEGGPGHEERESRHGSFGGAHAGRRLGRRVG